MAREEETYLARFGLGGMSKWKTAPSTYTSSQ